MLPVICAHLIEIAGYSLVHWIAVVPPNFGWFSGASFFAFAERLQANRIA